MKTVMMLLALSLGSCSDGVAITSTPTPSPVPAPSPVIDSHECGCKLNLGALKWYQGTLCPKNVPSKGHGRNAQGQTVVGCFDDVKIDCGCKS